MESLEASILVVSTLLIICKLTVTLCFCVLLHLAIIINLLAYILYILARIGGFQFQIAPLDHHALIVVIVAFIYVLVWLQPSHLAVFKLCLSEHHLALYRMVNLYSTTTKIKMVVPELIDQIIPIHFAFFLFFILIINYKL